MWKEGAIGIPDKQDKEHHIICHYWVKVYKRRSSRFGINGGRISKLMIKINGEITANYDRGWDVEPKDEPTQLAYMILLQNYN
ncbi:MAG: hypothetical protein IKF99_20975 [Oscillospiraceae bacterium]|nr:hypothetical protein [Oscillospiraceae bacterium]